MRRCAPKFGIQRRPKINEKYLLERLAKRACSTPRYKKKEVNISLSNNRLIHIVTKELSHDVIDR
jgi:hypothetical protein